MKVNSEKSLKMHNNCIKISCNVTLKQYALYQLMVSLSTKFQQDLMKAVGGVI